MTYFDLRESTRKDKKYMAIFYDDNRKKIKTTHFGSAGMSDYLHHKNDERKNLYLNRHRKNENWDDLYSAGSLARYILWNKTTLEASVNDYMKRFNLKKY
jgi:hypothetical protein